MIVKTVSETRAELSDLLGKVQHGGENVTILKHGKPVGVVVSLEEYEFLVRQEDEILARMGAEAYAEYRRNPANVISHGDLWAEIEAGYKDE